MPSQRMHRRTLLRGLGTVAIALPALEEMMLQSAVASPTAEVPVRAFNVFFGLGIPAPLQDEGMDGVFEPLGPLADKLLLMRGVDHVRCDESGINAHFDGASASFTAEPPDGEAKAGGPSIDQVIRKQYHPGSMPNGIVPTLVAGTFFRRSRVSRFVHSYNADGTVAATMQEKPRDLFDRVFGTIDAADDAKQRRIDRSVLDSVVQQYKFYTGANSPLGNASRNRIADHLERIREYETRVYSNDAVDPRAPKMPAASEMAHGGAADPGGEGIDMHIDDLSREWRLMADLYAMAIQLDRVRFGSLTFLAAGERLRMKGQYKYNGRLVYEFNDQQELGKSGSAGCSHEWWHKFNPQKDNKQLRAHAHMKMREVAYFLGLLDETNEANGKSILENSCITVSTESGDGRHNDVKRELSGVFHAITSAGGRFKTGQQIQVGAEGLDVYNTMLAGMGCEQRLGPGKREHQMVDSILS
ncbi:DUF1552 domain-containing protein [Stieleria sp. TO1_6]|uniref:DUF1552 domain-containing protein n=1 Tax=Stieleria tagensis TaxID=2956795 RepID=UPI00209B4BDF|nr:DUF1552 domain-containing protein [Stieleria tagensis]MCO8122450.1 DUF1552 domain-containing protein [Stieleria tagensis]